MRPEQENRDHKRAIEAENNTCKCSWLDWRTCGAARSAEKQPQLTTQLATALEMISA